MNDNQASLAAVLSRIESTIDNNQSNINSRFNIVDQNMNDNQASLATTLLRMELAMDTNQSLIATRFDNVDSTLADGFDVLNDLNIKFGNSSLENRFIDMKSFVRSELNNKMTELNNRFDNLDSQVAQIKQDMYSSFYNLNNRLNNDRTEFIGRFDTVDTGITDLKTATNITNSKLVSVGGGLTTIKSNTETISTNVIALQKLVGLKTDTTDDTLFGRLGFISNKLATIETTINTINTNVNDANDKLDSVLSNIKVNEFNTVAQEALTQALIDWKATLDHTAGSAEEINFITNWLKTNNYAR